MKEKIPEELRKEFEQAVLNADLDHWMVDNDRQFLDKIWDAVDKLFNQEVEKRIAERMPSDEEINKQAEQAMQRDTKDGRIGIIIDSTYYGVFCDALEWLLSCLTCSEKPNNSQKTEGGAK